MPNLLSILCVGTTPELLKSRQLVLESAGYSATCATTQEEACSFLHNGDFDILILSVNVAGGERAALRQAVSDRTRVIQLTEFTAPQDLLDLIRSK
jgi:DNA-binding response OmpR family regulator